MSLFDYRQSQDLSEGDTQFAALIMAAMRKADTDNFATLQLAFPEIAHELQVRYNAPGGLLESEIGK